MGTLAAPASAELRERALKSLAALPPFSPVLNKLMATLADEDVSFAEIADVVEKDTVVAGSVLRLVNSALYGMRGTINSVRYAISMMGISKMRNTVMSLSVSRMWANHRAARGWSHKSFNLHSVASAILADLLAAELRVTYPEGAFAAGLFQNIGILLISMSLPDEFSRIRDLYQENSLPLHAAEREILGFDHALLSGDIVRHWNLPSPILDAVSAHHGPQEPSSLSFVVHYADLLAEQEGILSQPWMRPAPGQSSDTLAGLGLPATLLDSFHTEFEGIRIFFR